MVLTPKNSEIVSKAKMSFKREHFKHEKKAVGGCLRRNEELKSYTAATQTKQSAVQCNIHILNALPGHKPSHQDPLSQQKASEIFHCFPHQAPCSLKHRGNGLNAKTNALVIDE